MLSLLDYPNKNNRIDLLEVADMLVLKALDKLLDAGADANAVDGNGYSVLFYVRTFRQLEKILSRLTREGITHRSLDGKSAMHVLTINLGNSKHLPKYLKILMKNGLDVDDLDGEEMTPLLYAIDLQNVAATRFLLSHGADPNHVTISGLGVYDFMKNHSDNKSFAEILYHLMEAGLTPTLDFLRDAKFVNFFNEYLAFKKYGYLVLVDRPRKKRETEYLKKIGYPIELVDLVDKDSHNVSISPSIEELQRGRTLLEKRDYSGYLDRFPLQSKRLKSVEWSKKVIFDTKSELNRIDRLIKRDNQVTLKPVSDKKTLDHISNLFISGSGPRPELFRVVGIYQIVNRYLTERFNSRQNLPII